MQNQKQSNWILTKTLTHLISLISIRTPRKSRKVIWAHLNHHLGGIKKISPCSRATPRAPWKTKGKAFVQELARNSKPTFCLSKDVLSNLHRLCHHLTIKRQTFKASQNLSALPSHRQRHWETRAEIIYQRQSIKPKRIWKLIRINRSTSSFKSHHRNINAHPQSMAPLIKVKELSRDKLLQKHRFQLDSTPHRSNHKR